MSAIRSFDRDGHQIRREGGIPVLGRDDVPEGQKQFLKLNAELSKLWPVINQAKPGPADADEWKDVKEKLQYLER